MDGLGFALQLIQLFEKQWNQKPSVENEIKPIPVKKFR